MQADDDQDMTRTEMANLLLDADLDGEEVRELVEDYERTIVWCRGCPRWIMWLRDRVGARWWSADLEPLVRWFGFRVAYLRVRLKGRKAFFGDVDD